MAAFLLLCRYYVNSSWMTTVARAATGLHAPPLRYSDSPDIAGWNASSLVCAERVVALGAAGYVVGLGLCMGMG